MRKPNRQTLLIGGAVACVLVALMSLLSGSGNRSPAESVLSSAPTSAEVPVEPGASSAEMPGLNPEFYQRIRQQLLAIAPEHQEPFVARDRPAPAAPSFGDTSPSATRSGSLPVLPVALQPPMMSGPAHPSEPVASASSPTNRSQDGDTPHSSQTTEGNPAPRLRGQIRDHAHGKIVVLFELNGTLLRASNEPNAEWRIVRIEPRQITVRNGEHTLVLEVPYAP
ncbi:hypothetical protein HRbin15_01750 [bacterium HR15]|nr:hypothetical protein HRbin15_01750 [bacterium HR15]